MSVAPSFLTPLRYPGGKARLGVWLGDLLRHNGISGGWYVEPYAGGAGAAIFLLLNRYVDHIVINDADPAIYAFWWAVLNDNTQFLKLIESANLSIEGWHRQREVINQPDSFTTTELGFATFFLNRTNRSGIIKAGVIGGQKQDGNYKLDARFNKAQLSERVKALGLMRNHISIYNMDAMDLLHDIDTELPEKCLIYLDPPYYIKGSQLYRNHYLPEDHEEIANLVQDLQRPWLVTYDNCEPIKALYSESACIEFSLHYSTHMLRPKATEVMFYKNLELHTPPTLRR